MPPLPIHTPASAPAAKSSGTGFHVSDHDRRTWAATGSMGPFRYAVLYDSAGRDEVFDWMV
jgi:hypothetical protein